MNCDYLMIQGRFREEFYFCFHVKESCWLQSERLNCNLWFLWFLWPSSGLMKHLKLTDETAFLCLHVDFDVFRMVESLPVGFFKKKNQNSAKKVI